MATEVITTLTGTSKDLIEFLRPTTVNISGSGYKPFSLLVPYFGGVNISAYCQPDGGILGGEFIVNSSGEISGKFYIPANMFLTTVNSFEFMDDEGEITSYPFVSQGTLVTNRINQTVINTTIIRRRSPDPLAQSFYLIEDLQTSGMFISSIGVFFKTKDASEGVELQLRTLVNGVPSDEILATVNKSAADVLVSSDSTAETKFTFDSPIYLSSNDGYAFILKTNSTKYSAWVADLGSPWVNKNKVVEKQPAVGVMYLSSNARTWDAYQTSDVKFKIYRAKFKTDTAIANIIPIYPNYRSGFEVYVETTVGSPNLKIFATNHGLEVGSKTLVNITMPAGVTNVNGIDLTSINGERTVASIGDNWFTVVCASNATLGGTAMVSSMTFEGNTRMDSFQIKAEFSKPESSTMSASFKGVSGKSPGSSDVPFIEDLSFSRIELNSVIDLDSPKMIPSYSETRDRFAGSIPNTLQLTMQTTNDYMTPVIDLDSFALIATSNIMNNGGEESGIGVGSNLYRYVIKPVSLELPAKSIKILFAANCVSSNDIDVYYRTVPTADSTDIKEIDWVKLDTVAAQKATTRKQFYDWEYEVKDLPDFNLFQVKFVGRGTKTTMPPIIKDNRILALAV